MSETPKWAVEAANSIVDRTGTCKSYAGWVAEEIAKHSQGAIVSALESGMTVFRTETYEALVEALELAQRALLQGSHSIDWLANDALEQAKSALALARGTK